MASDKYSCPQILVAAYVTDENGHVLLTRHAPYRMWHLPDGEVRFGERLVDALTRSFKEDFDTQLQLDDEHPWLVAETVVKSKGLHLVTHHFRATLSKRLRRAPKNGDLEHYWTRTDLLSVPTATMLSSSRQAFAAVRKKDWYFLKEEA